jgi:HSP20 family protein
MKDPTKHLRQGLKKGISRTREGITDGWRELFARSNRALTHFARPGAPGHADDAKAELPRWSLLACEVWETAHAVIVRVEVPGLKREDIDVSLERRLLRIRGEKRSIDGPRVGAYHLMERAFGHFERTIDLPADVEPIDAEVTYEDGIVRIIVPKTQPAPPTRLPD